MQYGNVTHCAAGCCAQARGCSANARTTSQIRRAEDGNEANWRKVARITAQS
jgi:hypothetical protein